MKKDIKRACHGLISVTAACLIGIKRHGQSGGVRIYMLIANPVETRAVKEPDGYTAAVASRARTMIKKMLGSFPCSCRMTQPSIYRAFLFSYNTYSTNFTTKKESVLDLEDKCITAKPASPNTKKRVEWFEKSGLERPRRTFSLARDDLEAIPAVL